MFTQTIKNEVESLTQNILTHNSFVRAANDGRLEKTAIVRYLKNCLFVVRFTPLHLKKAAATAHSQGETRLRDFMNHKWHEEQGHDQWAVHDLEHFQAAPEVDVSQEVTHANQQLMSYVDEMTQSHPYHYLAYITFVEYFTVLAAPSFLASLEKMGYSRKTLSVVALHEELDQAHVSDDLAAITHFIDTPDKQKQFIQVLRQTAAIINDHFTQLAEAA